MHPERQWRQVPRRVLYREEADGLRLEDTERDQVRHERNQLPLTFSPHPNPAPKFPQRGESQGASQGASRSLDCYITTTRSALELHHQPPIEPQADEKA